MRHLIIALAVLLFSCTEKVEPTPYTYPQLISGKEKKAWKLNAISFIEDGKNDINYSLPECILNDLYTFYGNQEKRMEASEGASKCSASDPNIFLQDSWSFVNATASLTFIFPLLADVPLPYIVTELNGSNMTLEIFADQEATQKFRMKFRATSQD